MGMRIAVAGAAGRMGKAVIQAVKATEGLELIAGLLRKGSQFIQDETNALKWPDGVELRLSDDPAALFSEVDGVIDFTSPDASAELSAIAADAGVVHIIGTTGFAEKEFRAVEAASKKVAVVCSSNMSVGANLAAWLVEETALRLGDEFDIGVMEMHHRNKKDAPSGTALMLAKAAQKGKSASRPERKDNVNFAVLRGGTVVGYHSVIFAGEFESIEISHRVDNRMVFAFGAVRAIKWASKQPAGLYSMHDVLLSA